MKLTTTKISIPVLMMMLFQSGHGMNDWFWQASELFVSGQTAQAVRVVHQNDPNFFRIVDPFQVSPEIQAIIDGTEDRINGWWDSIKAIVVDFVPRQADAGFQDRVINEFNQLLTGDIDSNAVSSVLSTAIVNSFYANVGFLDYDEDVDNQVTDVMNRITDEDSVWRTSAVPALEEGNVIPEALLGTVDPEDGTIKKFLSDCQKDAEGEQQILANKVALADLLTGGLNVLGAMEEEEGVQHPNGELDATYNAIVAALNQVDPADEGDRTEDVVDAEKEMAVYNALVSRAYQELHAVVPALVGDNHDEIPEALLGADYNNPAEGTIRKFISGVAGYKEGTEVEQNQKWTAAWNTLIGNENFNLSGLIVEDEGAATLGAIKAAVDGEAENPVKERAVYNILVARANEVLHTVVPALEGENHDTIPVDLLGEVDPEEGTIMRFLAGKNDQTEDAVWKADWATLITKQAIYPISALTEGGETATLELIKATIAGEKDPNMNVYDLLVNRANEVRGEYIPTIAESVVPWGSEEAKKEGDDAAWKSLAASFIGLVWQPDLTADALKQTMYDDSALTLATGLDSNPEAEGDHYGYEDSDELTFYLNLFGNRSIDGNEETSDEKETFLQSILTKIEADVKAEGDVGDPGTEDRWQWVDNNQGRARNIVQQAVYSVFGDKYAELLHHSNDPISDPQALFNAVTAGGETESAGAEVAAVEDFDGDAVSQIAEWLNDIKEATPAK